MISASTATAHSRKRLSDGSASTALMLSVGVTVRAMTPELFVGLSEFGVRVVKLVFQDARRFFKDGFGNREADLTVGRQVKKLLWLASELEGAHQNVRICDDTPHERARDSWTARSTTASTSSSVMFPRRPCPSRPMRSSQRRARSRSSAFRRELLDGRALGGGNLLHALVNFIWNRDVLAGHDALVQVYASCAGQHWPSIRVMPLGSTARRVRRNRHPA
jgi:hypothetical protein